jgi:hypothetical protein
MRKLVFAAIAALAGASAHAQCTDPTGDTFHLAIPRETSSLHAYSCLPQAVEIALYNPSSTHTVSYNVTLDVKGAPASRCAPPVEVKDTFGSTLVEQCLGQFIPPASYEVVSILFPAFVLPDQQVTIDFSCPSCVNEQPLEADATFTPWAPMGGTVCPRTLVQLKSVGCR